jgi:mRNA interferase RelE/StbE
MAWNIEFDPRTVKDLRDIGPSSAQKILDYFDELKAESDPTARAKPLWGAFRGLHRYRVEDLRAIVKIYQQEPRIVVLKVGYRREVYKKRP